MFGLGRLEGRAGWVSDSFWLLQITSEHCFCLSWGVGTYRILFSSKAVEKWTPFWLKCDWRSAWNLLWCGGTMTWLVSGLLASCLPWMDCATQNNPTQHHLTQRAFPWWITHTRIIQYIFVLLPAVEEPCKASQGYSKQITNKDPLCGTGNYTQYFIITYTGKEFVNTLQLSLY